MDEVKIPSTTLIASIMEDLVNSTQQVIAIHAALYLANPSKEETASRTKEIKAFAAKASDLQSALSAAFDTTPADKIPKTYFGDRKLVIDQDSRNLIVVTTHNSGTSTTKDLDPRLDLWNHGPSGMEWGYAGSGPAQLALAILADWTKDDDYAVRNHQAFKVDAIAPIKQNTWLIQSSLVEGWVRDHQ